MIRIYIAGALTGTVLQYLENMRRMMTISTHLLIMGFAPYCPCLDYHYSLMRPELEDRIPLEVFYQTNAAWIETCEAVLILPNWEQSKGTKREIVEAEKCNVPVFYTPGELIDYFCFPPDPRLDVLFEKWGGERV